MYGNVTNAPQYLHNFSRNSLVQRQRKHWNNMENLPKVKTTEKHQWRNVILVPPLLTGTDSTYCYGVSIVDIEQINASWTSDSIDSIPLKKPLEYLVHARLNKKNHVFHFSSVPGKYKRLVLQNNASCY